jgi:putative phosphoesterase
MRIGLISDIHANTANLRRAIILLREKGAETILCAGDLVDGATEGNDAAEFMQQQKIPCVQGNHDRALCQMMPTAFTEWFRDWRAESLAQAPIVDALTDETISFLRDLPLTQQFEWEDKRILLTHASPWDQVTYININGRREHFYRIAEEANADAVILGHTHIPMAVCVKHVWVFNPGSVDGNRYDPYNATCALLTLPEMHYEVFDIATKRPVQHLRARF